MFNAFCIFKHSSTDTPDRDLDLYQLPWDKISEDLMKNFDLNISDRLLRFTWLGKGNYSSLLSSNEHSSS